MLRDRKLIVVLLAGSLTTMAGGVIAPILPEMVQQLHLDRGLAANLVSAHCLTIALFSPLLGILADRVGRLRVLVISLIFYAIFGTVQAWIPDIWSLLVMRYLLGVTCGGIAAASMGLLGSMYEGEARSQALGYATSTLTITGILYPLLGGWIGASNWRFTFYLYGLGLPLAILAALVLKQKKHSSLNTKPTAGTHNQKLRKILLHPHALLLLLSLGLASIAMYAVVIYAPLYLKATLGLGSALNGIVLASRAVGAAIVSAFVTRRLSQRLGMTKTCALGFGLMALMLLTIPFLRQLNLILVAAVFFGAGFGVVMPSLYGALADLAPAKSRSTVLAAGTGAGFLGQFLSPILLAPLLAHSGLPGVFYGAAAVAMVTGLLLLVEGKIKKLVNPHPPVV